MMYLRWICDILIWGIATVFGPIGYFLARYGKFFWAENIWGNPIDGYCGDKSYKEKEAKRWYIRLWPCFWWSVKRNPANALSRRLGPSGTVSYIEKRGYLTTAIIGGKKYWLFYTPDWPIMFKLGYKLWSDNRINSKFEVGHWMSNGLAFSIQRGNKK